jgi:signal transduction histidine kinase
MFMVRISSSAQSSSATELFNKLQVARHDTNRVNIYNALSRLYWNKNSDSSLMFADNALQLANKTRFEQGSALAYLNKGVALVSLARYADALKCHFQALAISEKLGMVEFSGRAYDNIGVAYSEMGNTTKAIHYYKLALNIARRYDNGSGSTQTNMLINIGELYKKNKEYDSAIAYTQPALAIARKASDSLGVAIALYNISENYTKKKMYGEAMIYLKESWLISGDIKDTEGLAYCNNALGHIYYNYAKYDSSILYAKTGLKLSLALNTNEVTKQCYNLLYLNYFKLKDYENALAYRNQEISLTEHMNLAEREKAIKSIVADYELDKKQSQINLLKKDNEIRQKEIRTGKLKRNILVSGIVLLALVAFFLFEIYLQKRRLTKKLEKQNKEIIEQNRQLEELNLVKNRLFSIVSHDLRGPINGVRSMIDLMQAGHISHEESKEILPRLSGNLIETSMLLDNLLYWAKSQMNGMQLTEKYFDVSQVINQNIKLLQSRANEKQVTLQNGYPTNQLMVHADAATIDIVTRNLIENAVKFSNPGDIIMVQADEQDAFATVSVKDSGKGIPYSDQNKIFNKLTSFTTYGTASEKGSGLGLMLCKDLVENNKGKIWFTSTPGEGSTFSFTIPLKPN